MNPAPDEQLLAAVRRNCHVSDARHARGMSMCNYLLEMREYFRWERGLPLGEPPPRAELGRWLADRESLWNELDDANADYEPLPVGAELHDPFAVAAINATLLPLGLVYGAGIGRFHKPHFFLGELLRRDCRGEVDILVSGREYARDLNALPAALQLDTVYLRREAFNRWLWEKTEAWNLQPRAGAIGAALAAYDFAADPAQAIARMTEAESATLILHELGEHAAGRCFGPDWEDMLHGFAGRRAEVLARAVRDNFADCLCTLPALLERAEPASLHFWFANFDGMRRALFPRLAAAYAEWSEAGTDAALRAAIEAGRSHWQALAERLLELHRQRGAAAETGIEGLIDEIDMLAL